MFGIPVTTIKAVIFFALGFVLGNVLVPHNAFAFSYDRQPLGAEIDDPVIMTVTTSATDLDNEYVNGYDDCVNNGTIGFCYVTARLSGLVDENSFDAFANCEILTETETEYSFIFQNLPNDFFVNAVEISYNTDSTCEPSFSFGMPATGDSFLVNKTPVQPPNNGYTPPRFDLLGSTSILASVGGALDNGVKETGVSLWPLFAFLGVSLAFIIALQLSVFTQRTMGKNSDNKKTKYASGEYMASLPNMTKEDKEYYLSTEYKGNWKNGETYEIGPDETNRDYKAYNRGRKEIEKESPDFFKN
jgi:hypothetical protein